MKQCLVFTLIFMLSTTLLGQQTPRIEHINGRTFAFHEEIGDSAVFTIADGKDTLMTELFFQNGFIGVRAWRHDSAYFYRQFGQLAKKSYFFHKNKKQKYVAEKDFTFRLDGTLSKSEVHQNNQIITISFDEKGQEKETKIQTDYPSLQYSIIAVNNHKTKATRSDTQLIGQDSFLLNFDTTFYTQNRIKTLKHSMWAITNNGGHKHEKDYTFRYLCEEAYDEKGELIYSITPDSLRFFVVKDNVSCFYGFKNRRGDTLIPPRFDNIEYAGENFFICEEGLNKILLRTDGRVVTRDKMQQISLLTNVGESGWDERQKPRYFSYCSNNKYGVIDTSGRNILPPQSNPITGYNRDFPYFCFRESSHGILKKTGVIDAESGEIIGNGRYKTVLTAQSKDFFIYSDSVGNKHLLYSGLINRQGEVILPARYVNVHKFRDNLYWAHEASEKEKKDELIVFEKAKTGLFDAQNKRWLIKPSFQNGYMNKSNILYFPEKKQCGLIDSAGNWLLLPVYDTIIIMERTNISQKHKTQFIVVQKGKYSVFDVEQHKAVSQTYDFLLSFDITNSIYGDYSRDNDYTSYFYIAKKQDKWGIINDKEEIIVPFEYDYVGQDSRWRRKAFVKNNKAHRILEHLYPIKLVDEGNFEAEGLKSFELLDDASASFMINANNQVIVTPQYKVVSEYTIEYDRDADIHRTASIIENKQGQRKIVYSETGQILDYPFSEPILWTIPYCPFVVLDSTNAKLGIALANLKTGQVIKQVKAGALSLADTSNGTFFAKTTVPPLSTNRDEEVNIFMDTLAIDDNNWLMYDATGKQISKDVFRFPIPFKNGVGIGIVGEKYGLWQSNGTNLLPPQYENGICVGDGRFALFQNIGLKNWLVLFDKKGKKLINTGRYDGISDFYGKYALVKNEEKVGLVDTFGHEIVPLMDISTALNVNFRDSLELVTKKDEPIRGNKNVTIITTHRYFSGENNPDSLKLPTELRNMVWNELLSVFIINKMNTAATTHIKRALTFKTYHAYTEILDNTHYQDIEPVAPQQLYELLVDSQYIAFSVMKDTTDKSNYYNFVKKNSVWGPLSTNELFNTNPDNILKINDLLAQKIREMSDLDIDCGASSSFWERGQNRYLVGHEGITFYFVTKDDADSKQSDLERMFVPVLVTWEEMKPFLKK